MFNLSTLSSDFWRSCGTVAAQLPLGQQPPKQKSPDSFLALALFLKELSGVSCPRWNSSRWELYGWELSEGGCPRGISWGRMSAQNRPGELSGRLHTLKNVITFVYQINYVLRARGHTFVDHWQMNTESATETLCQSKYITVSSWSCSAESFLAKCLVAIYSWCIVFMWRQVSFKWIIL